MEFVSVSKSGRIATVSIKRANKANALSFQVMRELISVARSFEDDADTSAIILMGQPECFSMGFDLKDSETGLLLSKTLAEQRDTLALGGRMCHAWETVAPLTICAIEGWCLGGGLALAAACDLRVAGENSRLSLPEIERGLNLSWGTVPRITNLVGPARAKRLILLAEELNSELAQAWGLIDIVTEKGKALDGALQLATKASQQPPVPLRMGKQAINSYANAMALTACHADVDQFTLAFNSEDGAEGRASFEAKREAHFTGR